MRLHFGLSLALVLGTFGVAQAQPPYPYAPNAYPPGAHRPTLRVSRGEEAAEVLRQGMEKLLDFLGQKEKPNRLQVAAFLDKEIAPYFDFGYMARWVAGSRYGTMSGAQRKALAATLESRFLGALARHLSRYQGQHVRYFRPRMSRRGTVSVSVGILQPGTYPSKLKFRMYRSKAGWKVYDVVAKGTTTAPARRGRHRPFSGCGGNPVWPLLRAGGAPPLPAGATPRVPRLPQTRL
ncbi:MAG: ABC transporter substrate-binding protein [Chromatiaceae bacterium]